MNCNCINSLCNSFHDFHSEEIFCQNLSYEPRHGKTRLNHMRTTKAQVSLRNLISAFVVCCLDCIIPIVTISKMSRL